MQKVQPFEWGHAFNVDNRQNCLGMCGIDFFYFSSVFDKNSDSVWFGSVKKRGSVRTLQLLTTHVIANITATVDDITLTSLTTTTSK